ncbi:hypothetical protein SAMN02990966_06880 [Rhodospirillales bacterium URHD0017]|nr:hypothetical protein SAMN02990966_06880 [Rhodospirillales bacterium URHD0017]
MNDDRQDLSGIWQGLYSYPDDYERVAFVAVVIDTGGTLSGTTHERCSFQKAPGEYLYARLSGRRVDSTVTFVKTYDGTGGRDHSVDYEGTINEDATEISGQWHLPGQWSGPFLVMRANSKEDAVVRRSLQPVDES